MTEIRKLLPTNSAPLNRFLALLVPLTFLLVAYLALFSRFRIVGRSDKITLTQQQSQELAEQSKSYMDQSRYADALNPTLTLSKAYPENHIYLGRLAGIYDHLGRYEEEATYWERYMDHAPAPIEACPQIGQAYWKQGDKSESQAIAAYQRCLAIDPQNTDSIFYLAHALEMSNQWQQAADQYQKGLKISPNYIDLSLGLARCWLRMDRPEDARQIAQQILTKHPDSSGALLVLGMYYLHSGNYGAAKDALNRGAAMSEKDPDFPLLLIRVAQQTNNVSEELRQYDHLLELRPNDQEIKARRDALAAQSGSK